MRRLAGRVGTIDILASGYALCDGNGWEITANGRDFLRALEAVTQDNRAVEAGQPEPDDAENIARPRAAHRHRPSIQNPAALTRPPGCQAGIAASRKNDDHHSVQRERARICTDPAPGRVYRRLIRQS